MKRGVLEIANEIEDARRQLGRLEAELLAAQCDLAGVRVGDIIEVTESGYHGGKPPYVVKVTSAKFWSSDLSAMPQLQGLKRKKNGEWYRWPNHIYGTWRVIEHAEDAP